MIILNIMGWIALSIFVYVVLFGTVRVLINFTILIYFKHKEDFQKRILDDSLLRENEENMQVH